MVCQGHAVIEGVESRIKFTSTPIPKPSVCLQHYPARDGGQHKAKMRKGSGPKEKKKAKELTEIRAYLKETITNSWGWKEKVSLTRKLKIDRKRKKSMSRSSKHLKIRSKISQEMLQKEIRVKDGNKQGFGEENIRCREFVFCDFMESSL